MLAIKLDDYLRSGLERFISERDEPPHGRMDLDAAVEVIVRDWLQSQGYLPLPPDQDEVTTALDAADVPQD